jgi:hypothetical protein
MMVAAVLYCWALSDILAISNSMLTELASSGRSPAGTSSSSPSHPLVIRALWSEMLCVGGHQGDRQLALLRIGQRLAEIQILRAILGRFFVGDIRRDHLLAGTAKIERSTPAAVWFCQK